MRNRTIMRIACAAICLLFFVPFCGYGEGAGTYTAGPVEHAREAERTPAADQLPTGAEADKPACGIVEGLVNSAREQLGLLSGADGQPPRGGAFSMPKIGTEVGQQAPNFSLELRGGGMVTLSQLRGRPVFLHIFATWTGDCDAQSDHVQRAYEKHGRSIHFLSVSSGEPREQVDAYFAKRRHTYPVAYDNRSMLDDPYALEEIPTSFVLDEHGVILAVLDEDITEAAIEDAIRRAD